MSPASRRSPRRSRRSSTSRSSSPRVASSPRRRTRRPGPRERHPHRLRRHVHAGLRQGRRCRRRGHVTCPARTSRPSRPGTPTSSTKHEAKFGKTPISAFHAHAYDATNILFDGDREGRRQERDGTLYIPQEGAPRRDLRDQGLPGHHRRRSRCSPTGDCGAPLIADLPDHGARGRWRVAAGGADLADRVAIGNPRTIEPSPGRPPGSGSHPGPEQTSDVSRMNVPQACEARGWSSGSRNWRSRRSCGRSGSSSSWSSSSGRS